MKVLNVSILAGFPAPISWRNWINSVLQTAVIGEEQTFQHNQFYLGESRGTTEGGQPAQKTWKHDRRRERANILNSRGTAE